MHKKEFILIFYYKIKKFFSCELDLETSKMLVLEGAIWILQYGADDVSHSQLQVLFLLTV